jgi:hypothetical protein
MPINFQQQRQTLRQRIDTFRGEGGGQVFAQEFTQWYDQAVRTGSDAVYQNPVATANPAALQQSLASVLQAPGPPQVFEQALRQGIIAYWTGATLALAVPPPGTGPVVSNVVTNPGTFQYSLPQPTDSIQVFISTVVAAIQQHLTTLQGITTSLTPTAGGPVPVTYPWAGYQ